MVTNRPSPLFKLTVWRPCRWEREYLDLRGGLADRTSYQESIYSWETSEDPYGAIADVGQSRHVQESLRQFEPGQPPSERSIEKLREAITAIDGALTATDDSAWSDSQGRERLLDGDTLLLRQHKLLALYHHLQWVCDTFASVPDANITIR